MRSENDSQSRGEVCTRAPGVFLFLFPLVCIETVEGGFSVIFRNGVYMLDKRPNLSAIGFDI